MANLLAVFLVSFISLYFSSGVSVRKCVKWPNYGIRYHNYCYIDLKKNFFSKVFMFEDALRYCIDNGGFVNNTVFYGNDRSAFKTAGGNFSSTPVHYRFHDRQSSSHLNCSGSVTTNPRCEVTCAFNACPAGTFSFPTCQSRCRCEDIDHCDIDTGLCFQTTCAPGFFGPPTCHKCNCYLDAQCDVESGECPLGCRNGWRGKSCQQRNCRGAKCRRLSTSDSLPCVHGETGTNCTKRACHQGFYNPPDCNMTCYCLYPEFCDGIDGDCGGTPCMGRRTGRKCLDVECPLMYFGVPVCSKFCFCRKFQPCTTDKGKCPKGCHQGWGGLNCNQRFCPKGRYSYPACNLQCNCKNQDTCNSFSGVCELLGCADDRSDGTNCTKPTTESNPAETAPSEYSKFSGVALVLGTIVIIAAVCVQAMTHHEPTHGYGRRTTLITSIQSTDSYSSSSRRKSRVSFIQQDNRHLSICSREAFIGLPDPLSQTSVWTAQPKPPADAQSTAVDNIDKMTH